MFLRNDDLARLTGYQRNAEQRRWLDDQGVPYKVRNDGAPVLTLRIFEESCLMGRTDKPNWGGMKRK